MSENELLKIHNLITSFLINNHYYAAVDGCSLTVMKNEIFGIIGESGCGKSTLALSITKLHPPIKTKIEGSILFKGKNLVNLSDSELNEYRGRDIGIIFQDPLSSLNPLMKIGEQIEEPLKFHTDMKAKARRSRTMELLNDVGMKSPTLTYSQYPYELSGGMRQRVMIAMALACKPSLVIADEPTAALDVTVQMQILDLLKKLQQEIKSGIILITHSLSAAAEIADKIAVMYSGQIVEIGTVADIFKNPKHPYTRLLFASVPGQNAESPRLQTIDGIAPAITNYKREGCRFSNRIPWIDESEHERHPQYHRVGYEHYVLCTCYRNFRFKNHTDTNSV